jgi:hypothetical protein
VTSNSEAMFTVMSWSLKMQYLILHIQKIYKAMFIAMFWLPKTWYLNLMWKENIFVAIEDSNLSSIHVILTAHNPEVI